MSIPSLFDSAEGGEVRRIHERMEETNAEWMKRVRNGFAFHFAGREVTTDDLWGYMEANDLRSPASPNLLGSFFSGWDRAKPTSQFARSNRKGAHGNLLRKWRIV